MLTQTQHTPGPWQIANEGGKPENKSWYVYRSNAGHGFPYDSEIIAQGLNEANARLIAAAPELLEALELAERMASSGAALAAGNSPRLQPDDAKAIDKIRAAIAKARGQS